MNYAIDTFGYPLGFAVKTTNVASSLTQNINGREVIQVEACHLLGHQREAIVKQGGSSWRLTSDEGLHLKGTDLAPFPFGYFNAGLQADVLNRIRHYSKIINTPIANLRLRVTNEYWLLGSFVTGTGRGVANPSQFEVHLDSDFSEEQIRHLLHCAIDSSPAIAFLKATLKSTFSLTINGNRKHLSELIDPIVEIPQDPFLRHAEPPAPSAKHSSGLNFIQKLSTREEGEIAIAPPGSSSKIVRIIHGHGGFLDEQGLTQIESWLALPGMSHFLFMSDEGITNRAPSGLGLLSAGIAFCFITQIARYIENMKLSVDSVRLVQLNPFSLESDTKDPRRSIGHAEPIETHLFLNGTLSEEMFELLLNLSARTCYLHATALNALVPNFKVIHNSKEIIL